MIKFVVMMGNMTDGFSLRGPFPTSISAKNWASDNSSVAYTVLPIKSSQDNDFSEPAVILAGDNKNPGSMQIIGPFASLTAAEDFDLAKVEHGVTVLLTNPEEYKS